MQRFLALVTAVVAWASLALQVWLTVSGMTAEGATVGAAIWRLLAFFTILTNFAVAIIATAMTIKPDRGLASPRIRLAAVVAIALVGVVYSVALRSTWNPTGWQAIADHLMHDVTPPLFVITWLVASHGSLTWRDSFKAMLPPLLYCAYVLGRGASDGFYPYWFLDANAMSLEGLVRNVAVLALAFYASALVFIGLDRLLGRKAI